MSVAQRVIRWRSSAGEGPSVVQTESTHCPDDKCACQPNNNNNAAFGNHHQQPGFLKSHMEKCAMLALTLF